MPARSKIHMLMGAVALTASSLSANPALSQTDAPQRAREAGVVIGVLQPGANNSITDVEGVTVGHATLDNGKDIRTGVTAILPHGDNLFQYKVPAGFFVANGFGKFMGSTQVEELGEIETPILLTNTLSVPEAASAIIDWTLSQKGNENVRSVNAVVGETNDGMLNDIRGRHVTKELATQSIRAAKTGPVAEGNVGAGTGTVAFDYKGGIGTSSRKLPAKLGGYTVGVLVQSNYGGVLNVAGAPIGQILQRYYLKNEVAGANADGSVVIVIATDAPLSDRNLARLAERSFVGIARTGSSFTNGSGDYAIAFSVNPDVRRSPAARNGVASSPSLGNDEMSPLFQAVAEATEEAVLNSMFTAQSMTGHRGTIEALPVKKVREILKKMPRP